MDDNRLSNLLFLAGLASLAMPGCDGKGADTGGGPNPSAKGNPLDDDNSLTDGNPDEPGTAPSPGDRPGATGGGGAGLCEAYAAKIFECGGGYYDYGLEDYGLDCQTILDAAISYGGPGCRSAIEDLLACLSRQPCDALECPAQEAATEVACEIDVDEGDPIPETTGFPDSTITDGSGGDTDFGGDTTSGGSDTDISGTG